MKDRRANADVINSLDSLTWDTSQTLRPCWSIWRKWRQPWNIWAFWETRPVPTSWSAWIKTRTIIRDTGQNTIITHDRFVCKQMMKCYSKISNFWSPRATKVIFFPRCSCIYFVCYVTNMFISSRAKKKNIGTPGVCSFATFSNLLFGWTAVAQHHKSRCTSKDWYLRL